MPTVPDDSSISLDNAPVVAARERLHAIEEQVRLTPQVSPDLFAELGDAYRDYLQSRTAVKPARHVQLIRRFFALDDD